MIQVHIDSSRLRESLDPTRLQEALEKGSKSSFCDFSQLASPIEPVEKRAREIRQEFDQVVYVGIGGSYWAPNALNSYFADQTQGPLLFLDSPEAKLFHSILSQLKNPARTHFIFVSKSGSTLEPVSLLSSLIEQWRGLKLSLAKQSTLLCSPGSSPMRSWAEEEGVPVLEIPSEVGGRYSSLTVVGLLASELLGLSARGLLEGARDGVNNKSLVKALCEFGLQSFASDLLVTQFWVYSESLWPVGQWWQQLWSESLAKNGGPAVSTPMVCCGPRDQHSLLQQLMEGQKDKSVLLLQDDNPHLGGVPLGSSFSMREEFQAPNLSLSDVFRSEIEGFCGALRQKEIPLARLHGDFSRIQTWGEFFMVWQLVVASMGFYLKVNPFDQPGVELGKILSSQYLKSMNTKES